MTASSHQNANILADTVNILIQVADNPEPRLPQPLGAIHISFYGLLKNALGNRAELVKTWLRTNAPEQLSSVQADFSKLFEEAHDVDHERSEGNSAAIAVCMAKATARKLAEKLHVIDGMVRSAQAQPTRKQDKKPAREGSSLISKKFKRWPNPGDASFVIVQGQNERLHFHHNEQTKDLYLRSNSRTLNLMVALAVRNLTAEDVKRDYGSQKTKCSNVISRANTLLNERIAAKGFTVPPNTEFVTQESGNVISTLTIYPSMDDFNRAEVKAQTDPDDIGD